MDAGSCQTLVAVLQERYSSRPKPKRGMQGDDEKCLLPARVAVDSCGIGEVGTGTDIRDLCSHVQELDLTKNTITDWSQVFVIVHHIPQLHFLNLTFNLLDESTLSSTGVPPCTNVTSLVLNGTRISWSALIRVLSLFPSLSELHASLNSFPSISALTSTSNCHVTKLYLNECAMPDINTLGEVFPCLESLTVINNNITGFSDVAIRQLYPALNMLNISDNPIASWEEIDKIADFPELKHLRISGVPFLETMPAQERRQHLISRLPNLSRLNGSPVSETEREDAERVLIRHFMDLDEKPARYATLEALHGKLDPLVKVDLAPRSSVNMLVKFEGKEETLPISLQQNVGELKKFLQNFTGLTPSKFRLFYIEKLHIYTDTTELKNPNKRLVSLNIHEEDWFEIDRK